MCLNSPWKQRRYSSFCILLATCKMAMGKLWEEAANTAEASDTSFLSRNSAEDEAEGSSVTLRSPEEKRHTLHWYSYPRAHTASFLSHRTCWCRWWCCSWSDECSCMAPEFQFPVNHKKIWRHKRGKNLTKYWGQLRLDIKMRKYIGLRRNNYNVLEK